MSQKMIKVRHYDIPSGVKGHIVFTNYMYTYVRCTYSVGWPKICTSVFRPKSTNAQIQSTGQNDMVPITTGSKVGSTDDRGWPNVGPPEKN